MKHIYLLLIFCVATLFANAQIVNIPDPVFKDLLVNGDPVWGSYSADSNNDGEIQISEAENYTYDFLEIVNHNTSDLIYDFTGLEAFINVNYLYCEIYGGASLDLGPFQQLRFVEMHDTVITSLDVSQNIALEGISIDNGNLTSLDLSQNVNLTSIYFPNHQLTNIIFPNDVELIDLVVSNNQLTTLDLSPISAINSYAAGYFNISNNPLTEIDFGDLSFTGEFRCENTLLTNLNVKPDEFLAIYVNDNYNLQYIQSKNPVPGETSYNLVERIYADNCPNLIAVCVEYPDAIDGEWGNMNWFPPSEIPAQTIISTNCSTNTSNYNIIFGDIRFDQNNDGCDINDLAMSGIMIKTSNGTDNFTTSSFTNGSYLEQVPAGIYDTSIIGLPAYYSYAPTNYSNTFTGLNESASADFCVTSTQTINDVNVTLLPTTEARPGFNASYQLVYKNVGTTTLSGDVTLQFDETMQIFISATPIADASTVNTQTFNYANLQPFESRSIDIVLNTFTPGTVDNGDVLNFTATITPDSGDNTPNDNVYTLAQTVVNSFDPNDKQVLQGAEITSDQTTEYLDYLIRFQNTGTASAINISVTDVLNDKLDWNTFQMVSTSHPYELNITNGNFVQFVFDGINLPAEQDNEPASHGFIAFKIKPKSDVVIGDIITGQANIYFDYNAPIITNEVSTEVVDESTLSVNQNQIETLIALYPNPVNNQFNIELSNGIEINSVEVFDISGKQLLIFEASEYYNISNLTSGVYFVKVKTNRGELHKQVVKQ